MDSELLNTAPQTVVAIETRIPVCGFSSLPLPAARNCNRPLPMGTLQVSLDCISLIASLSVRPIELPPRSYLPVVCSARIGLNVVEILLVNEMDLFRPRPLSPVRCCVVGSLPFFSASLCDLKLGKNDVDDLTVPVRKRAPHKLGPSLVSAVPLLLNLWRRSVAIMRLGTKTKSQPTRMKAFPHSV